MPKTCYKGLLYDSKNKFQHYKVLIYRKTSKLRTKTTNVLKYTFTSLVILNNIYISNCTLHHLNWGRVEVQRAPRDVRTSDVTLLIMTPSCLFYDLAFTAFV